MRAKRGVGIIKKLLFFSASLSIIALGAVWVLLFNEPMADTMMKEPAPKKRALAYEQALAEQPQDEVEAPKAEPKPSSPAADTASSVATDAGNTAAVQPAPGQQVAALPQAPAQPPGQPQPQGQGQPAPQPLPWLNQQGDSVVVPPGQGAGPNGQAGNFFDAPQQNPVGQGQAYGQQPPPYGGPPPRFGERQPPFDPNRPSYGPPPRGPGQPYDQAARDPNLNRGQAPYPGPGGYGGEADRYPAYPGQAQPGAQGQYPPGQYQQGQYPPGQISPGQIPPGQVAPGQYPPGQVPPGQYPQGQQPGFGGAPYGRPPQEWAKVIVSGSGMRLTASEESPVLFAFPYGRDLKVVSRNGEWVEVSDPNSNAKGWIQAYALGPSAGPPQYGQAGGYYGEQMPQERRRPLGRGGFADMINRAFGN